MLLGAFECVAVCIPRLAPQDIHSTCSPDARRLRWIQSATLAQVPPLFRELAVLEAAIHVLECSLFWSPRDFPCGAWHDI